MTCESHFKLWTSFLYLIDFFITCVTAKYAFYGTVIKLRKIKLDCNLASFSSKAFIILLKLLIFALAVLQIFNIYVWNVKLLSMIIQSSLTDLADFSLNCSSFIFKGLCITSNIYWNFPKFVIIWLLANSFNALFRSNGKFSMTFLVVSPQQ